MTAKVRKSEMTISLYVAKAARLVGEAEEALCEAEQLAYRARNLGIAGGLRSLHEVRGLRDQVSAAAAATAKAAH